MREFIASALAACSAIAGCAVAQGVPEPQRVQVVRAVVLARESVLRDDSPLLGCSVEAVLGAGYRLVDSATRAGIAPCGHYESETGPEAAILDSIVATSPEIITAYVTQRAKALVFQQRFAFKVARLAEFPASLESVVTTSIGGDGHFARMPLALWEEYRRDGPVDRVLPPAIIAGLRGALGPADTVRLSRVYSLDGFSIGTDSMGYAAGGAVLGITAVRIISREEVDSCHNSLRADCASNGVNRIGWVTRPAYRGDTAFVRLRIETTDASASGPATAVTVREITLLRSGDTYSVTAIRALARP